MPVKMPTTMPSTYRLSTTSPRYSSKNAEAISPYTGSLAEQETNGSSMMVMRRSFSFSIVRAAMAAGTVQPKPISIGMKDLSDRPKRLSARSIRNAVRER